MPFVIRYPKEIPPNPQRGHRHHRRFRDAVGRYAGAEPPQQAQAAVSSTCGRHAAGVAPQHVLPLLTQHEIRPAHMGIRNDRYKLIFYGDRLGMTGLTTASRRPRGVLRLPDRSAREPEPVRQPGLYGSDRSDETRWLNRADK
ncbi:MAG: hypothetical protein ACLRMJ_05645 [Alistipes finegoldii]